MKAKSFVMIAVALGCGLVAMLGVQRVLKGGKKDEGQTTMQVLVAVKEIPAGVPLDPESVTFKEMLITSVPEDAVTQPEQYQDLALKTKAFPGEFILESNLGENLVASRDIPAGMRVVSVPVNSTTAVAGFVQPGDRVDVLVTLKSQREVRTATILEYIEVFAADKTREAGSEDGTGIYKNISLLVTPEQSMVIRLAGSQGELHFALRHPEDKESADLSVFSLEDLLKGKTDKLGEDSKRGGNADGDLQSFIKVAVDAETVAKPEVWTITIYEGAKEIVKEIYPEGYTAEDEQSDESAQDEASATQGEKKPEWEAATS